jgi:hypothetical protein
MLHITIRDKETADEDNNSPYTVLITRNSTNYVAYKTIEEFMKEWNDTLSILKLNCINFTGQKALYLMADYTVNDSSFYSEELDSIIKNGARACQLLSNGSVMPGAILVDANNRQTTFFRLNPNDKKYKELTRNI